MYSCLGQDGDGDSDGSSKSIPSDFTKEVKVFNITVLATSATSDDDLLHVATILAEYLDSNEDGTADNTDVAEYLANNNKYMVVCADQTECDDQDFGNWPANGDGVVTVLANEMRKTTDYASNGFDPAIEEVLHFITSEGFAETNTSVFGEEVGSSIADAMDTARGGQFSSVPSSYPSSAWFTYNDSGCDYKCQVTEYTYWAITTYLEIQHFTNRSSEIGSEWGFTTKSGLQSGDTAGYAIVNNSNYKLPSVAPNLSYTAQNLSVESR